MRQPIYINGLPFVRQRLILVFVMACLICAYIIFELSAHFGGWGKLHQEFPPAFFIELLPFILIGILFIVTNAQLSETRRAETEKAKADFAIAVTETVNRIKSGAYNIERDKTGDASVDEALKNIFEKFTKDAEAEGNRNWTNEGLVLFREITGKHSEIRPMCEELISTIVKYLKCSQGGIFILNDAKKLELYAAYAFERKKYLQKVLDPGEGLVGQCFLEGHRIYLTKVPQEYIHITSGLGGSNPNCVLILPLKNKETIVGVCELASFTEFSPHQLELLDKAAESITQSILTIQASAQTRELLDKSLQRESEMKNQEELTRQSMEELYVTQEDMRKMNVEMEQLFKAINTLTATVELNTACEVIKLNDRFLHTLNYTAQGAYGHPMREFLTADADGVESFTSTWKLVLEGKSQEKVFSFRHGDGSTRWLRTGFFAIQGAGGTDRVLCFLNDVTEIKLKENALDELNREVEAFRKMLIRILNEIPLKVFLKQYNGKFFIVNDAVSSFHGFETPDGLIGKSDFDFYDASDAKEWLAAEQKIIAGGKTEYTHEDHGRILHTVKMPFYIDPLNETGLLGFQADVTELELLKKEMAGRT
jgi:PAS domain S-box-containing protein